ncbi:MAG: Asp-tRNA(Asn)/Glu-tRNA(Gln) amidotransferase subunit GatA [Mycoplasmatales bacterium]|nr:Asp-tRNA(Asn)/Glu-tRNA(Gln) amidotransferase subunit GatA [Mycoplasmatales bacterium]
MIKIKGNIAQAKKDLENNPGVSFIYKDSKIFDEGPLAGAVITIKDLYATNDAPTQSSSKILENFNSGYDATIIKKLKKSGASIVGKVHLDELALGGTGTYSAYGLIDNPLNKDRIVGGSSSGSASTLNENITASIASDTGDSTRLPASYNGLVGYKPSYGAISRYGQFSYASSLDTVGVMAHNVNDALVIASSLFGKDELDMTSINVEKPINDVIKPKKVAFLKNVKGLKDYQIEKYDFLKKQLIKENIEIVEFEIDENLVETIDIVYQIISFSEASSNNSNLNGIAFGNASSGNGWNEIMTNTRTAKFGPLASRRFTLGAFFLSSDQIKDTFYKAQKVRRLIVAEFKKIKKDVDILLFPASSIAPKKNEEKDSSFYGSYLIHSNLEGSPSITIPWGKHKNMPFGLSIDGRRKEDKKLISHALYIEKLLEGDNHE